MSSLSQALKTMRAKQERKPGGHVIIEPTEIGDKTIKGTILTGASAGQEIEFLPKGKLGAKDYTKGKTKVHEGGTLRVEGLKEGKDGVYDTRWVKTFVAKPDANTVTHYDVPTSITKGRDKDANGNSKYRLNELVIADQKLVENFDDMVAAIRAGLEATGSVSVFGAEDGKVIHEPYFLQNKQVEGKWVTQSVDDFMEGMTKGIDPAIMNEALASSPLSVVPVLSYPVGSTTAENIDLAYEEHGKDARIQTVNPADFRPLSIGIRTAIVLAAKGNDAIAEEYADRLEEQFMANASDAAKAEFNDKGWISVSDTHMADFYASQGKTVASLSDKGWAPTSIVLGQFDGTDQFFVKKSFSHSPANPYPPVEACKDLKETVLDQIRTAIVEIGKDAPQVDAEEKAAKAEAKAAKAEAKKADAKEADPELAADDASNDEFDNVLDMLGGEGMVS